jgi:putative spermidine/putrescine transport system ATP-binding protein
LELELRNLSVILSGEKILDSINLTVEDGSLISLLGASGCGKSTLLKTTAGIITPDCGSVYLNGNCADDLPPHKRGTVIVFQDLRLFPHMTVAQNITFPLKMRGAAKEECSKTASELLEKVQLKGFEKRRIQEMSGGQLQRVALARALAAKPDVLLLDEPFSSLDENLRKDMRKLVLQLQKDYRITTVLVTHDYQEALSMSDRVALMRGGRILQYDTPERIYNTPDSMEAAGYFGDASYLYGIVKEKIFISDLVEFSVEKPDGQYLAILRSGTVKIKSGIEAPFAGEAVLKRELEITEINYWGEDYSVTMEEPETGFTLNTVLPSPCMLENKNLVSIILNLEKVILIPNEK